MTDNSHEKPGICETTPGVKSYAGYVHLPPGTLSDVGGYNNYSINTFFWFFESRKDPANAPLSIWFNGGPGASSLIGALQENGPCLINDDSNSTSLNPWSFNNEVNMLYIDQPNQVGFSWDVLTNGTLDKTTDIINPLTDGFFPKQNNTFYVGTFPSQDPGDTANDTQNAAKALWHFAQTWFQEFPSYKPNNDAISIFTESYGGHYGPVFTTFFEEQNMAIANGSFKETGDAYIIHLDTLGIFNGCIDLLSQEQSYPTIAYNNTYGIQAIDETTYKSALANWNEPRSGCLARILECQASEAQGDPYNYGNNQSVSDVCYQAIYICQAYVDGLYDQVSGRNPYDFAAIDPDPFPPNYYLGYLSQAYVQAALGVPVNFTDESNPPYFAFSDTGDFARSTVNGGYLQDLAFILDSGIKVALIYGDRDYICNWLGGENVSLNVPYSQSENFHDAGYANISTNATYIGGQVRQYGNFSFSRVFQSGHEVPAYQPETAYQIFSRAIFGNDIATGTVSTNNNPEYATQGSSTTFQVKNQDLGSPSFQCYILALETTCTDDQIQSVLNGTGLVHDYILIDKNQTNLFPGIGNNEPVTGTTTGTATGTATGAAKPAKTGTGGAGRLGEELTGMGLGELILAVSLVVLLGL